MRLREKNLVRKDWRRAGLRIALCYPGSYRSGMSGLTVQTLYGLFNGREDVLAERFFEREGTPRSIESGRPLKDFDVIAFTLQFEEQYASVLRMLLAAGIEPRRSRRRKGGLVIGGGPCATANPIVLSDFFDLFVMGELEPILDELCATLSSNKGQRALGELTSRRGFYVPGTSDGGERVFADDLERTPHVVRQIVTEDCAPGDAPVFGKCLMVESSRGCPLSCRFCLSSHIYSPFRFRSSDALLKIIRRGLDETGVDRVAIIGSGASFVPGIDKVLEELAASKIRASIPSLLPKLLLHGSVADHLAASGLRSITLAPETGCSLRFRVGKRVGDDEFIEAASICKDVGIRKMKLYFMVGLPSETKGDLADLMGLAGLIGKNGPTNISASLNVFVPKPQTPFQFAKCPGQKETRKRYALLRKGLRMMGWPFSGSGVRRSAAQAVLSLGGTEVGVLLLKSVLEGGNWVSACYRMRKEGLPPVKMPWSGISPSDASKAIAEYRQFLEEMGERATDGPSTTMAPGPPSSPPNSQRISDR